MLWDKKYDLKHRQVELRGKTDNGTQILMIVSLGGWEYKNESRVLKTRWQRSVQEFDVRLSMNGPAYLVEEDLDKLRAEVDMAKDFLRSLDNSIE